jgi:Ni,Fe-hydrogenase III small subunit/formate hydrogenlyase subunit 6/NADH:ubiquinone oxidoreductase subunit I
MKYPAGAPPALSDRFRGRPLVDAARCAAHCGAARVAGAGGGCGACAAACPTGAIATSPAGAPNAAPADGAMRDSGLRVDLGKCIFCPDCGEACPAGALSWSGDWRLSTSRREDLVVGMDARTQAPGSGLASGASAPGVASAPGAAGATYTEAEVLRLASALKKETLRLFGRSLKLREVSAGGCNACEADVNVLGTIGWDLGRFGISMVASPRHADGILVTGPVSRNMELALRKTYDAVAEPKIVIAVGSCAISGGPFSGHEEVVGGICDLLPVDLYVPGCPPHPLTTLEGLLRLLGRIR